ncbi:MAG: histidine phosphatase family protein [Elusimicrobiota bacterium]
MTTLYFIRHAQSHPKPDVDEPDWPLSALGQGQARRIVPLLRPLGITRLYCSPYRRCRDTLAPFAELQGLDVSLDPGLRERKVTHGWCLDFTEVWRRSWEDFSFAVEGCESSWTCRSRIIASVEAIAARHPGETLGLGSHGNAIALFLHHADPSVGIADAERIRNPEILRVERRRGRFHWDRGFSLGEDFDRLATHFRATPGVTA